MMVISIIIIALSIVIGVGTLLWIRKKDNTSIKDMNKKQDIKDKEIKALNIAKEKFGIDDISNNIITLENYKKRCIILKIKNSDYNMLSEEGQSVSENVLRQLTLSLQYDISFYSTTRVFDMKKPLLKPKKILNTSENQAIRQYNLNYISHFEKTMSIGRIAEREDYIILAYTGEMNVSAHELQRRAIQFIENLKKINTKCKIISTDEIIDLIYHDLNRNELFNLSYAIKLGALDMYVGHKKKK